MKLSFRCGGIYYEYKRDDTAYVYLIFNIKLKWKFKKKKKK